MKIPPSPKFNTTTEYASYRYWLKRQLLPVTIALNLVAAGGLAHSATILFSNDFQSLVASGTTTLAGAGWTVGNGWGSSFNTTTYSGTATAVTNGNNTAFGGLSHTVSGINFSDPTYTAYEISAAFATNASEMNGSNRFAFGLSYSTTDQRGIYAYLGNSGGSNNYIGILTGAPNGTQTISSLSAFMDAFNADTFYRLTLSVSPTLAVATLYDASNAVIGTTSFALSGSIPSLPLTGTPLSQTFPAITIAQRDGNASNLDYFSQVSVIAVPEPNALGMTILGACSFFVLRSIYFSRKRLS